MTSKQITLRLERIETLLEQVLSGLGQLPSDGSGADDAAYLATLPVEEVKRIQREKMRLERRSK